MPLKKDLPRDVLDVVQAVEDRADECWRDLRILRNPSEVAVWAFLTGGIAVVEREQAARGSKHTALRRNACESQSEPRDWREMGA